MLDDRVWPALLAHLMMASHLGFVVIVVAGGFLSLRWRWLAGPHIVSVVWGLLPLNWCPLTEVQNWARVRAGGQELSGSGFVDHYFVGVVFPASHQALVYAALAALVATSWVLLWLRTRPQRAGEQVSAGRAPRATRA